MRMLFLTTRLPFPPIGGEKLRPFYFLKYLSKIWKITLIAFIEKEYEKEALKGNALDNTRIRTVILPRHESYLNCLKGIFAPEPLETAYYASKKMERAVKEEILSQKYDLLFCHLIRMAPYLINYNGPKKVLDICDALSLRYALSSHLRRGPFKYIEFLESKRLEIYEPRISKEFDLSLVASDKDKAYLERKLGIKKLEVVENGINPADVEMREVNVDPKKIVFFSNLRAFPNIDAVEYFYEEIFPLIKARIKDVKLTVAGADIPPRILALDKDSSVTIVTDMPDIRTSVEDACVSVAPMRIAVGIQNKILQAMAFRVPVVTTSLGLGSIRAEPARDILIADTPDEFAQKVVTLMENQALREEIRTNAYRLVSEKYLWPDIAEGLNRKLKQLF